MKLPQNSILQNLKLQNKKSQKSADEKNILSLDYGEKFCGFAFSPDGICVFPLEVVDTNQIDRKLPQIIQEKNAIKLIVGLPLEKDGSDNPLSQHIRLLISQWKKYIPIETVNERFSSQNVVFSGSKKQRIDDLAAAQILEFYLQKKTNKEKRRFL